MKPQITTEILQHAGMCKEDAAKWLPIINDHLERHQSVTTAWKKISQILIEKDCTFNIHHATFVALFPTWRVNPEAAPVWTPDADTLHKANLKKIMDEKNFSTVNEMHLWSREHMEEFWQLAISRLGIVFMTPPDKICDLTHGSSNPSWLPGSNLNIVDSCLKSTASRPAISYFHDGKSEVLNYCELETMVNRIANSLVKQGFKQQDTIAIAMPMNPIAVASYLAIIKIGATVVSIADSFSSHEMKTRMDIANTAGIITQDFINWGKKRIPLYSKICEASDAPAIVVRTDQSDLPLRSSDIDYDNFIVDSSTFDSVPCEPMQPINILFSSGTTGTPKAIPWNHTTALKAASDAYFHQNIQPGDVLCWPTNLGWMMGPWLIFAALINNACIALYSGAPHEKEFGEFVESAGVTMLGVVPTLVANWHRSKVMEAYDWSHIKVFSSTGECSNPEDMFYLMWLANYKPVIEYCGGTEIGGGYISSTVVQDNYPSLFTTPTMGSDFIIINDDSKPADIGEAAIIPPALGLSVQLINADHEETYYRDMPSLNGIQLRRHGDQLCRLQNGMYSILGRVDDTMNLGGIKISSAEIERVLSDMDSVRETAAIAVKSDRGPSKLIIYAAANTEDLPNKEALLQEMQLRINQYLNPLFKISDLVFIDDLPKTASNKIMRRLLRQNYNNS